MWIPCILSRTTRALRWAAGATQPMADDAEEGPMTETMECLVDCAYKGDWERAKNIFDGDPDAKKEVTSTYQGIQILDCASTAGQWEFFNEMVRLTDAETLTTAFASGNTILHGVANCNGSMKCARALVEKCPSLTQMTDEKGFTPFLTAIDQGSDTDLIWYLALVTTDEDPGRPFSGPSAADLLYVLLAEGYYDITHFLLQRHSSLAEILLTAKSNHFGYPALKALASQPLDFPSGIKLGWLARCIYSVVHVEIDHFQPPSHVLQELGGCRSCGTARTNRQLGLEILSKQSDQPSLQRRKFRSLFWKLIEKLVPEVQRIRETKFKQECAIKLVDIACQRTKWSPRINVDPDYLAILDTLETATTSGIIEILSIYMQVFPLPLNSTAQGKLLRAAIENRQDKIFNFFLRKHPNCNVNFYTDDERMNSLHTVAKLRYCPKITSIAGAAFQMQEELKWFQGIEKLVRPSVKLQRNNKRQTPWELFRKEHETMQKEGEGWMKNTANSCMLVATLIATVVFAAAFTVPGGNQDNGTPIFLVNNIFILFVVFDALALFSSVSAIWMFLSILTARFAQEDFYQILPKRLIFGLATMFLAIVSSIITFSAALSLVLGRRKNELIILIVLMAFTSVAMFAVLQLPLFIKMVRSTYCNKLLGSL